ncbi:MAG TPA: tetratricopeptide repeat protein [Kofleriaceae bacterium]
MPEVARAVSSLLVAIAVLLAPVAARADRGGSSDVPAKARMLAERGRAFHDAGDYANAITAFTQAYVIAPSPALLFNLAQAYRLQGDCEDAALMYRRYLATNPSAQGQALAETHLASVERCVHMLSLHIPVERASSRAVPPPPPPRESVVVTRTQPAPSRRAQIEKDVGVGLVLGGTVALAAATYYTVAAHNASSDVAAAYATGAKWKDVAPIDERGKTAAARAKILGAGGVLGVAGGIVAYLIGRHTEQLPVTVAPTRHGVELGMSWAF